METRDFKFKKEVRSNMLQFLHNDFYFDEDEHCSNAT